MLAYIKHLVFNESLEQLLLDSICQIFFNEPVRSLYSKIWKLNFLLNRSEFNLYFNMQS